MFTKAHHLHQTSARQIHLTSSYPTFWTLTLDIMIQIQILNSIISFALLYFSVYKYHFPIVQPVKSQNLHNKKLNKIIWISAGNKFPWFKAWAVTLFPHIIKTDNNNPDLQLKSHLLFYTVFTRPNFSLYQRIQTGNWAHPTGTRVLYVGMTWLEHKPDYSHRFNDNVKTQGAICPLLHIS